MARCPSTTVIPGVQDYQEKLGTSFHLEPLRWNTLDPPCPAPPPPPPLHPIYLAQPCLTCPGTHLLLLQGLPG